MPRFPSLSMRRIRYGVAEVTAPSHSKPRQDWTRSAYRVRAKHLEVVIGDRYETGRLIGERSATVSPAMQGSKKWLVAFNMVIRSVFPGCLSGRRSIVGISVYRGCQDPRHDGHSTFIQFGLVSWYLFVSDLDPLWSGFSSVILSLLVLPWTPGSAHCANDRKQDDILLWLTIPTQVGYHLTNAWHRFFFLNPDWLFVYPGLDSRQCPSLTWAGLRFGFIWQMNGLDEY